MERVCAQYQELLKYTICKVLSKENYKTHKESEKCDSYTGKERGNGDCFWGDSDVSPSKHPKATTLHLFNEPKETMSKTMKQGLIAICHKTQNKKNSKKNQSEIGNTITKIFKSVLQKLHSRFEQPAKKLEDQPVEIHSLKSTEEKE